MYCFAGIAAAGKANTPDIFKFSFSNPLLFCSKHPKTVRISQALTKSSYPVIITLLPK